MNIQDLFLLCFAVGVLWTLAALLLGIGHTGHFGSAHPGLGHHAGSHFGHGSQHVTGPKWLKISFLGAGDFLNPSCLAIFLAWFGGVGFILARHTGLGFWAGLLISLALGTTGAWIIGSFLRFLHSREQPLDPADYELVGVLGRVSSPIRSGCVGELIYIREGARRALCARSDNGQEIGRDEEVIVTRYEKGIAYVRTWEAMTR
jgi:membrane protein implicated in regulation of membrane protease activity